MTTPTEICERLDAIRVRADRATPGPWAFESHGRDGDYGVGMLVDDDNNPVSGQQETGVMLVVEPVAVEVRNQLDAEFIANARDDVPFLLDLITAQAEEIERLKARAEAAEAALEKMRSDPSIARFARLLGICHKIKWTDHRTPATGNDETDAALEDLAEFLFLDAVADLTTQGGGE